MPVAPIGVNPAQLLPFNGQNLLFECVYRTT